ncbi:hypothetical protein DFJ77DRAFT_543384 [Powellomyces hirtus]|nr:hypothetical protein DFJ77DRAFT_543384 [Powellomyces hirtus]
MVMVVADGKNYQLEFRPRRREALRADYGITSSDFKCTVPDHERTTHNDRDGDPSSPESGEIIRVRLPLALDGPGSSVSSSAPSSAKRANNYYTAVVLSCVPDRRDRTRQLVVLPIPSYSKADAVDPELTAPRWLSRQDDAFRELHVPVQQRDGHNERYEYEGPTKFIRYDCVKDGAILACGEDRPAWVLLRPMKMALKFSATWKSFSPRRFMPVDDLSYITARLETLPPTCSTHHTIGSDLIMNPVLIPTFHSSQFILCDYADSDDDESDDEGDVLSYLKNLNELTGCAAIQEVVTSIEDSERQRKNTAVEDWLSTYVQRCRGGNATLSLLYYTQNPTPKQPLSIGPGCITQQYRHTLQLSAPKLSPRPSPDSIKAQQGPALLKTPSILPTFTPPTMETVPRSPTELYCPHAHDMQSVTSNDGLVKELSPSEIP